MVLNVIVFLLMGLVAGAIARFLVPGRDPMGLVGTMLLGVVGAFVGGTLGSLVFQGDFEFGASGFLGAIVGGVIALLVYRAVSARA